VFSQCINRLCTGEWEKLNDAWTQTIVIDKTTFWQWSVTIRWSMLNQLTNCLWDIDTHLPRFTYDPPLRPRWMVMVDRRSRWSWHSISHVRFHNISSTKNFRRTTRQTVTYTILLVCICTCSWKTIDSMLVSASEPATSLAWYSRTLRMSRGPSTNIWTPNKISEAPESITVPVVSGFYGNDKSWLQADADDRPAHREHNINLDAEDTKRASTRGTSAKK
jgi:hypothetical protein